MSWDMKELPASGNREAVQVTSFFGGAGTGRCLQLGQWVDTTGRGDEKEFQFIHLTREQLVELVQRFEDWDSGACSEHEPFGREK